MKKSKHNKLYKHGGMPAKGDDEEISEDMAFNEEDEDRYGHFFSSAEDARKGDKSSLKKDESEYGEFWQHLIEDKDADDAVDGGSALKVPPKEDANDSTTKDCDDDDDKDDSELFDRLEEDTELFLPGFFDDTEYGSYRWIIDAPEDDKRYKDLVETFRKIEEDIPYVPQPLSTAKSNREQRRLLYERVTRDASKKWVPVLRSIKKNEQKVVYGEDKARFDPTCGTLSSNFVPETPLEMELHKTDSGSRALEKAIMAREQREQKRINRIKSKRWHKRQNQRDMQVAAKILERTDDPDVKKSLLEDFEKLRAEKRILRKRKAQSRWAKFALRYGGTNMMREVSRQQQQLKDNESLIHRVVEQNVAQDGSEDEHSQEEEIEPSNKVLDKLEVIKNPEAEIPEKGLFGLKFMKDAVERKRNLDKDDLSGIEDKEYYEIENIEVPDEYDDDVKKDDSEPEGLPKISDFELEKAMSQINERFAQSENLSVKSDNNDRVTSELALTTYGPSIMSSITSTNEDGTGGDLKGSKIVGNEKTVLGLDENTGLDNLIEKLNVPEENKEVMELSRKLFVTRPEASDYIEDVSDQDEMDSGPNDKKLRGWGEWTGFGITEKKPVKLNTVENRKIKAKLKVTKKRDQKLSRYYVHRLPHPYHNKNEYNAKMSIPLGPEWNTLKTHMKLTQPKKNIKPGTVIPPLSVDYSTRHNRKRLIRKMGKEFIKNRTHAKL